MTENFDWRKLRVHRDERFEDLVEKLCATKSSNEQDFLFKTIKEFMVLAAMVGFEIGEFKPFRSKVNTISIPLDTYSTTKHDAYIYLLALAERPTLDILKEEHLKEAIEIFEGYCNAGLNHIDDWVINNMNESLLENVLFKMTLEFMTENQELS
ncbi:hypothetical protein [Vibrio cyclitrophicus]